MNAQNLKKNIFFNILKSLMGILFPLISFPYASRILLPDGIGKINFVNSIVDYFLIIALLGINTYAAREGARLRQDKQKLSDFAKEMFFINFISTVISLSSLFVAISFIDAFFTYKILIIVTSIKILFTLLGFDWLYISEEDFSYITIRSFIFQLLSIILLFTLVKDKDDYIIYAFIGVFSSVGSNICNFFNLRKYISLTQGKIHSIKKHLKPIFIFFGSSCAAKIQTMLDTVMLGIISGDISVGYYSAATKLMKIINTLINTIAATLLPRTSFYIEKNDTKNYSQILEKTINLTIFLALPSCTGLIILTPQFLELFSGKNYLPATSTMRIITPCILFGSLGSLIDSIIFIPLRKEKYTFYFQIYNCILNIILNLFFIRKFGAFGAALATLIVEFLNMFLKLVFSRDIFFSKSIFRNLFISLAGTFIMALGIILFDFNYLLINLLSAILIGSFFYATVTILMKHESAWILLKFLNNKIHGGKQ